jgi:hypothetical protein
MKFLTLLLLIVPFAVALVEDGMIPQDVENMVEEVTSEENRDLVRYMMTFSTFDFASLFLKFLLLAYHHCYYLYSSPWLQQHRMLMVTTMITEKGRVRVRVRVV